MLIQRVTRALLTLLIAFSLVLGAAKPRTIGFGFFFRLFALDPLLNSFEIDQIAHDASLISRDAAMRMCRHFGARFAWFHSAFIGAALRHMYAQSLQFVHLASFTSRCFES
jgi:hypothetical protein